MKKIICKILFHIYAPKYKYVIILYCININNYDIKLTYSEQL